MTEIATGWLWFGFSIFLILALTADTWLVNHGKGHSHQSMKSALYWSLFWIGNALLFNVLLWLYLANQYTAYAANAKALEFFTGYVIEKSLSVDNLFVFYMVFKQFHIPQAYQQRVFSYGIWGAVIMRLLVILAGTALVNKFHWLLYVMGVVLMLTGIKIFFSTEQEKDLSDTLAIKLLKRFTRITTEFKENDFFIRKNGLLYATPLFVALFFIEFSDLVFALDSIPAIFAITTDPFIVWTSNIFAILGLRALYFLLSGMISKFRLLKYGIALILIFVGIKMVIEPWVHVPVGMSLAIIASVLLSFAALSIKGLSNGQR